MNHIIYRVTCAENGKVYIGISGKTLLARWRRHVSDAMAGSRMVFHAAIRKYGPASFTVEQMYEVETRTDANLAEQRLIAEYDSTNPVRGYNVDPGGTFHGMSPEARRKIGETHRRQWATMTPDQRAARIARLQPALDAHDESSRAKVSSSLKEWFAAKTPEQKAALEAKRHASRVADREANFGQVRAYRPKEPRTSEQRAASARKASARQSASMRETLAAKSVDVKRAEKLRMWETRRAQLAAMTPEEREAKRKARKPRPVKSPEEHAAILAKSWEARRAKMAAACPAPVVRINLLRLP